MTWKRNVKNDNAFACNEGKTSFWKKLATSPNGEKPTNKHTKPKQKKKHTFENNSKHAKMQCTPKMKFKFGTWGRTKNTKMKKKLHI